MTRSRFRPTLVLTAFLFAGTAHLVIALQVASATQAPAVVAASNVPAATAKIWLDDRVSLEESLRTAKIAKIDDIGIGVTKPKRAYFAAGGPVASASWKPLRPGRYNGYWESYKSEIAAYELDKVLGMDMVPPTVERTVSGEPGAATIWVAPVRMFKVGENTASIPNRANWDRQVRKMKLFDNLIHNPDRNAGNLLIDPSGNLILIDHSRAFESQRGLVTKLERYDRDLWTRIDEITPEALTAAVQKYLTGGEIKAMLDRREAMRAELKKLLASKAAAQVLVP